MAMNKTASTGAAIDASVSSTVAGGGATTVGSTSAFMLGMSRDELMRDPLTVALFSLSSFTALFCVVTLVTHIAIRHKHPFNRRPQFFLNGMLLNTALMSVGYALRSFALISCFDSKPLFWYAYSSSALSLIMHSFQVLFYSLVNKQMSLFVRKMNKKKEKSSKVHSAMSEIDQDSFILRHSFIGRTQFLFPVALFLVAVCLGFFFIMLHVMPASRAVGLDFWTDRVYAGNFDARCSFPGETAGYGFLLFVLFLGIIPMLVVYNRSLRHSPDGLGLIAELRVLIVVWAVAFGTFAALQTVHPIWPLFPILAVLSSLIVLVWFRLFVSRASRRKVAVINKRASLHVTGELDKDGVAAVDDVMVKLGSLDRALNDAEFRGQFAAFLQSELCLENLLFIDIAEQFRQNVADSRHENAKLIFEETYRYFVPSVAPLQVNLSARARAPILEAKKQLDMSLGSDAFRLTDTVFKVARKELLSLLQNDQYPRFALLKSQGKLRLPKVVDMPGGSGESGGSSGKDVISLSRLESMGSLNSGSMLSRSFEMSSPAAAADDSEDQPGDPGDLPPQQQPTTDGASYEMSSASAT